METITFPGGSALKMDPRAMRLQKLRKTVYNAACGIEEQVKDLPRRKSFNCWFVTLTYEKVGDWRPQHIRDYMKRVRAWAHRRGFPLRYVWVAELQKRGAVHYHILFWIPRGLSFPRSDSRGWWSFGSSNTQVAKKRVAYLMKYASKGSADADHDFPKGCRLYGFGGVDAEIRQRIRWWRAPARVRRYFSGQGETFLTVDLRKVVGGWVDKFTGLVLKSCWKLFSFSKSKLVFFCVSDPEVFDVEYVRAFASRPLIA